ncbi:MAG: hypothetical protein WBB08_09330 [Halobacteriota archaeon]|jgi:alkyl sulfatase BDS1-like metallo-beta-lactamase superfamily hydrolase
MKKRSTNIYPKILLEEVNEGFEYLYEKEQEMVTNKILLDHARMSQKKKIIQLNETIYQFRGYGISNMIVINTDEGFVLIDTLLTKELSEEAKKDFNRITGLDKEVIAVSTLTGMQTTGRESKPGLLKRMLDQEKLML